MLKACGYIVFGWFITLSRTTRLYTYPYTAAAGGEYKSSTLSVVYNPVIQLVVHTFFTPLTSVINQVVHTIHTTNKNIKKFYTNNLLLIYRRAV